MAKIRAGQHVVAHTWSDLSFDSILMMFVEDLDIHYESWNGMLLAGLFWSHTGVLNGLFFFYRCSFNMWGCCHKSLRAYIVTVYVTAWNKVSSADNILASSVPFVINCWKSVFALVTQVRLYMDCEEYHRVAFTRSPQPLTFEASSGIFVGNAGGTGLARFVVSLDTSGFIVVCVLSVRTTATTLCTLCTSLATWALLRVLRAAFLFS